MQVQSCGRGMITRVVIAAAVAVLSLGTLAPAPADTNGGFEDHFNAPSGTLLMNSPAAASWTVDPSIFNSQWVIESRPTTLNTAQLGTVSVLVNRSRANVPNDPMAFVKKDLANFVFQAQAAFDRTVPINSGVGVVFRAPVDPNTGVIDRKNLYLLTSVNAAPNPRTFPTGHAFMVFKRVAGQYFMAAPPVNTWTDFSNSKFHTYKVSMVNQHIQAWIDGMKIFDLVDSPGDDQTAPNSPYKMPGPAFVAGAVGLRAGGTQALFDDVIVASSPAYEGRATAMRMYGQAGLERAGANSQQTGQIPAGTDQDVAGGDTGFQYHDHDFNNAVNGPLATPGGPLAVASVYTLGETDETSGLETTRSAAEIAGFGGVFSDPSGRTTVTISADLIRANASASCQGTASSVDVVNLTWEVVYKDANGNVLTSQGNTTKLNAVPNTNLMDPRNQTGSLPQPVPNGPDPNGSFDQFPVRITLHSLSTSSEPQRMDAAGIRIAFLQSTNVAPDRAQAPGNITADVALANVVAGKLCD